MADKRKKGYFGDGLLPVAKSYLYPSARTGAVWAGVLAMLLIFGIFFYDVQGRQGALVSNGPLSTHHATFGKDCSTCHSSFQGAPNEKCGTCHEKYGRELGRYSFEMHYLYRTTDFSRLQSSPNEQPCATCHGEHQGRNVSLTDVSDEQCTTCHEFGSFNTGHPQFEFARDSLQDRGNLAFPHTVHVNQVMEEKDLVDVQKSCLYCHNAEESGKGFKPINFEEHCGSCHLTANTATPWLQTTNDPSSSPGVLALETIRAQSPPGTRWAYFSNPNDYESRAGRVRKRPLYHKDQWIMENLKQLREVLYPSAELASLLTASADVPPRKAKELYKEALGTLRKYAEELRAQPSQKVQQELRRVEKLLDMIQRRLKDPLAPVDETKFVLSPAELNPDLSEEQVASYRETLDKLTQPCQTCHRVENASIARVQKDQDKLIRAEFNHGDHIIHTNCLDCHNQIPIRKHAARDTRAPTSKDRAAVFNLPTVETCQSCHSDGNAPTTCVSCHVFHPNKQRSNLLRYAQ